MPHSKLIPGLEPGGRITGIMGYVSGNYYFGPSVFFDNTETLVVVANRLFCLPLEIPIVVTLQSLFLSNVTVGAGNARMGLYHDGEASAGPGKLLVDAGELSVAATGAKEFSTGVTLQPGKYWLTSLFSSTPTVRSFNNTTSQGMYGYGNMSETGTGIEQGIYYDSVTYGALPATAPALTDGVSALGNQFPLMGYRAA